MKNVKEISVYERTETIRLNSISVIRDRYLLKKKKIKNQLRGFFKLYARVLENGTRKQREINRVRVNLVFLLDKTGVQKTFTAKA